MKSQDLRFPIPREAFFAEERNGHKAFWVKKSEDESMNGVYLNLGYVKTYEEDIRKALFWNDANLFKGDSFDLFLIYYLDDDSIEFYGYPLKENGDAREGTAGCIIFTPDRHGYDLFRSIMDDETKKLGYESLMDLYESNEPGYVDKNKDDENERP